MNRKVMKKSLQALTTLETKLRYSTEPAHREQLEREADRLMAWLAPQVAARKAAILEERRERFRRATGVLLPAGAQPIDLDFSRRSMQLGGYAVLGLEVACAGAIGAVTFNLPVAPAFAVGTMITLTMAAAMKAVIGAWFAPEDPLRGLVRESLDLWCRRAFWLWLASVFVIVLLTRVGVDGVPAASFCFNALVTIVAVLSPMLGSMLLVSADERSFSVHGSDFQLLELLEAKLAALSSLFNR